MQCLEMKKILAFGFSLANILIFVEKVSAELDRPLNVEMAGSTNSPKSRNVLLAYGRELSSKFQKLEDSSVYALIEINADKLIIAKIEVGAQDVAVVGERVFSQLSYLGLFMPDNCADAIAFDPKDPNQVTRIRFRVTPPTNPVSIKILKDAERGAIRNSDRVTAAEMRWLKGDWQETARHLELAGRDFFRKNDRLSQVTCKRLEQIARGKVKK